MELASFGSDDDGTTRTVRAKGGRQDNAGEPFVTLSGWEDEDERTHLSLLTLTAAKWGTSTSADLVSSAVIDKAQDCQTTWPADSPSAWIHNVLIQHNTVVSHPYSLLMRRAWHKVPPWILPFAFSSQPAAFGHPSYSKQHLANLFPSKQTELARASPLATMVDAPLPRLEIDTERKC